MKIITLCGSLKFQKEMMEIAEKVALEGNCILTPVYPVKESLIRINMTQRKNIRKKLTMKKRKKVYKKSYESKHNIKPKNQIHTTPSCENTNFICKNTTQI